MNSPSPRSPVPFLSLALALALTACAGPQAPAEAEQQVAAGLAPSLALEQSSVKAGINDNFLDPGLDVESFIDRFEGESREIAANRGALVEVLRLAPGMDVADVGSGTGLFLSPLARGVGAEGTVYAVDISPVFVEHLRERAAEAGLAQVQVVQCSERSAELPEASVDLIFVCDTYHHFEFPQHTLASLRSALRPGGRLVVVDFERIPGVSRDWMLDHVRAGKEVFRAEIEAAGFGFVQEVDVAGLEENYLLIFRRD